MKIQFRSVIYWETAVSSCHECLFFVSFSYSPYDIRASIVRGPYIDFKYYLLIFATTSSSDSLVSCSFVEAAFAIVVSTSSIFEWKAFSYQVKRLISA